MKKTMIAMFCSAIISCAAFATELSPELANKVASLGYQLPIIQSPTTLKFVPYVIVGNQVTVSGQLPNASGALIAGKLGEGGLTIEQGQKAARECVLNILAHLNKICGGKIDHVKQIIKLEVFVASTAEFTEHPEIANAASELINSVFGECGKHARIAVGMVSLPKGAAVEVAATVLLNNEH